MADTKPLDGFIKEQTVRATFVDVCVIVRNQRNLLRVLADPPSGGKDDSDRPADEEGGSMETTDQL